MTRPSLGRVVHLEMNNRRYAALIVYVWSDRRVNLVAFDHSGSSFRVQDVQLLQPGDSPIASTWCEWPKIPAEPAERSAKLAA